MKARLHALKHEKSKHEKNKLKNEKQMEFIQTIRERFKQDKEKKKNVKIYSFS